MGKPYNKIPSRAVKEEVDVIFKEGNMGPVCSDPPKRKRSKCKRLLKYWGRSIQRTTTKMFNN